MSRVTQCGLGGVARVQCRRGFPAAHRRRAAGCGPQGLRSLRSSLVVDPRLRFLILDMRRRAPTFRRQVARLANQPRLVVTLVVWQLKKGRAWPRARAPPGNKVNGARWTSRFGWTRRIWSSSSSPMSSNTSSNGSTWYAGSGAAASTDGAERATMGRSRRNGLVAWDGSWPASMRPRFRRFRRAESGPHPDSVRAGLVAGAVGAASAGQGPGVRVATQRPPPPLPPSRASTSAPMASHLA